MRPLIRFLFFIFLTPVQAQIDTSYVSGSRIEEMAEFQYVFPSVKDALIRVPLPKGEWEVKISEVIRSTHSKPIEGWALWLQKTSNRVVSEFIHLTVYPNLGQKWNSGNERCQGELIKRKLSGKPDDFCYSVELTPFLTALNNNNQNMIRKSWREDGIKKPEYAISMTGMYYKAYGFTVTLHYRITSDAVGIDDRRVLADGGYDPWKSALTRGDLSEMSRWYEDYAERIAQEVWGDTKSSVQAISKESVIPTLRATAAAIYKPDASTGASQPTAPAISIGSAHALVIGNAAYPGSARLDNPINDANAVSQKLRSMGFNVTTVTDANRQRLVQAMSQFRRTAAAADVSLLFYSGHGVQILGKNYMLPTDVDQSDVAQATIQGVSLNEVVENFLPGKTKLVFLDACRDNPLQRTGDRSVSRGLAPIAVAEGTLIAYATKDGQVASDGAGQRNSPFTQAFLEHISDSSDIAVVLRKVREKVMRSTGGKQQPWEYGSLTGGELVLSAIRPAK